MSTGANITQVITAFVTKSKMVLIACLTNGVVIMHIVWNRQWMTRGNMVINDIEISICGCDGHCVHKE